MDPVAATGKPATATPGVPAIGKHRLLPELSRARTALGRAYVLHVAWFATMCAFVALHWSQHGLKVSVLLTLVTVPPVLFYTVRVHRLCRRIDPSARTVGLVPVLVTTVVLSPFESGLILPAKNLIEANRILRTYKSAPVTMPASDTDPGGACADSTRSTRPTSNAGAAT